MKAEIIGNIKVLEAQKILANNCDEYNDAEFLFGMYSWSDEYTSSATFFDGKIKNSSKINVGRGKKHLPTGKVLPCGLLPYEIWYYEKIEAIGVSIHENYGCGQCSTVFFGKR